VDHLKSDIEGKLNEARDLVSKIPHF